MFTDAPGSLPTHLLLLNCIYELLECVSHELQVLESSELSFLNACVDRKEACLIYFLRLNQSIDPVLLPSLQRPHHLCLMEQMLLILTEVLSANILNLAQLLVVFFLQPLSIFLDLLRRLHHKGFQFFYVRGESFFELIGRFRDLAFDVRFVHLYHVFQRIDKIVDVLVIPVDLLFELFTVMSNFTGKRITSPVDLLSKIIYQVAIDIELVLVFFDVVVMFL